MAVTSNHNLKQIPTQLEARPSRYPQPLLLSIFLILTLILSLPAPDSNPNPNSNLNPNPNPNPYSYPNPNLGAGARPGATVTPVTVGDRRDASGRLKTDWAFMLVAWFTG